MNKENNQKSKNSGNLALCIAIIAVLGFGGFVVTHYLERKRARRAVAHLNGEIRKNQDAKFTYMVKAPEFEKNHKFKRTVDSLENRNNELFLGAQQKYFARIDRRYPMGAFFDATGIAELNKIIMPYVAQMDKSDPEWNFIKQYTPIKPGTTIPTFERIISVLDIPAEKFAAMDMIIDAGYLYMFNDPHQQKTFEAYLRDIDMVFADEEKTEPNFKIREVARIKPEYTRNKNKIAELNADISINDSIIEKNLTDFDRAYDSLNALLAKNNKILRR